jgi:hypothetical protein
MADFLLVETQGRWSGPGAERLARDARALAAARHRVVLLLAGDAVDTVVRPGPALADLPLLGAEVWADGFALEQRALAHGDLPEWIRAVDLARVADAVLRQDSKVVWH